MLLKDYQKDTKYIKMMNKMHGPIFHRFYVQAVDPEFKGGAMYLIQLGDSDIYKIGITRKLKRRLKQLQSKSPVPLHVVKTWIGHDYHLCEKLAHQRFKDKRIKGEWFKLDAHDLRFLMFNMFPDDGHNAPYITWEN